MLEARGRRQGARGDHGGNTYGEYEFAAGRGQAMTFRILACHELGDRGAAGVVFEIETLVNAQCFFGVRRLARALIAGVRRTGSRVSGSSAGRRGTTIWGGI